MVSFPTVLEKAVAILLNLRYLNSKDFIWTRLRRILFQKIFFRILLVEVRFETNR